MIIGQFIPGQSWLHCLHPKGKLIFVFIYTFLLFWMQDLTAYAVLAIVPIVGYLASGVSIQQVYRSVRPVFLLAIILFLLHLLLTKGGRVVWETSIYTLYSAGLEQGTKVVVRLLLLVLTASLLTLTTSTLALTDAFSGLLKPLERVGVPINSFAMMMSIALRFIPVIGEEMQRIRQAQMIRGASLQYGTLRHRLRSLQSMLIPIFLSIFRRADELAFAMEAKCYNSEHPRTQWRRQSFTQLDLWFAILTSLLILSLCLMRWWH
ncbi:energy-coupling factor transport system permease protein [Seinonella peptonophila]|uniref:Energy-coupling factor transport system permease protein n=2 Tax=Seinonella peptonophila TaxID=112248 RepID=A0A1M4YXN2_9BACL|nr:energy-coupling factor transport system permease protein [Seinonella peptonophila]